MRFVLILLALIAVCACSGGDSAVPAANSGAREDPPQDAEIIELRVGMKKIEPFFSTMGEPRPADWLESHREPGQTFEEYLASRPVVPTGERDKLYTVALGDLTRQEERVIATASAYLATFFDVPVKALPASKFRAAYPNVRHNRFTRTRQVRTGHILESVLMPMLPPDAAALIAFTADDLYPDETMNYVFGQASLANRVGVWSLSRLDDHADEKEFLQRTLKIAAHETGHMFSMRHCTKYECVMSGTNHLGETDRRPIDACPECTAKICWLSKVKMTDRYARLDEFCQSNNLRKEAAEFRRKAAAVR